MGAVDKVDVLKTSVSAWNPHPSFFCLGWCGDVHLQGHLFLTQRERCPTLICKVIMTHFGKGETTIMTHRVCPLTTYQLGAIPQLFLEHVYWTSSALFTATLAFFAKDMMAMVCHLYYYHCCMTIAVPIVQDLWNGAWQRPTSRKRQLSNVFCRICKIVNVFRSASLGTQGG